MGLGKTVEVAALVLSHPMPALQLQQETTADGLLISRYCSSEALLSDLHIDQKSTQVLPISK